jgi:hypothetical protein
MRQILAFEHPTEGLQLVNGTIEPGEDPRAAALRGLEESGVEGIAIARDLGTWSSGHHGHVWSFQLCTYQPRLPETWMQHCAHEGGQHLRFFWHDMHGDAGERWAHQYRRALAAIRERAKILRWRG